MYRERSVQIKEGDPLYNYCVNITKSANNMYNATLFRCRQVRSAFKKDPKEWTDNEKEVIDEIKNALPLMKSERKMPDKTYYKLGYGFLNDLMKTTMNPDYYAKEFSVQAAQQTIKDVLRDLKGYDANLQKFYEDPSNNQKPHMPYYQEKGGCHTAILTNQDCKIKEGHKLSFPKTNLLCDLGDLSNVSGKLKQVKIKPEHGIFRICATFKDESDEEENPDEERTHCRVCSIDLGVDNFAAVTNNVGLPCLLFKGGVIKSANQWYNKRMAEIKSKQAKETTEKFVPTAESKALSLNRDNKISDIMHKIAKQIVQWCDENNIDTIVIGNNNGWKQNSDLRAKENQNFVHIPYEKFKRMIEYLAKEKGISVIRQEESYTSKASFLDNDPIPTWSAENDAKYSFSGRRAPTQYNGHPKFQKINKETGERQTTNPGFRGLYKSKDGTIINADLNGSANIGRKALPDMYENKTYPDFTQCNIIVHPDDEYVKANREKQLRANSGPSKSKQRRDKRKARKNAELK